MPCDPYAHRQVWELHENEPEHGTEKRKNRNVYIQQIKLCETHSMLR